MANESLPELPPDWPGTLGESERRFLLDAAQRRLRETIEFGDQQEAKALALVRISLIVIAVSGIFGDLRIAWEWSPLMGASVLALLFSLVAVGLGFWLLHPQSWETGMNVRWFAQWARSGADTRDMEGATLEDLVEGFGKNVRIAGERGGRLVWLLWAVAIQTLCVVLVQVAAAVDDPA